MFRLDLEDLQLPLLPCVQPSGLGALPPLLLGPAVAEDHGFVAQHVLQVVASGLLEAVLQERLGERRRFEAALRLTKMFEEVIIKESACLAEHE